jgi:hypothetical protein
MGVILGVIFTQRGWSALMWACQTFAGTFGTKKRFLAEEAMSNRRKVVEVLLEAGADVNIKANVSG